MVEYSYESSQGLAIGVIVAIAVCGFVSVCIIPAIFLCLWQRRKSRLRARTRQGAEAYAALQSQRAAQGVPGTQAGGWQSAGAYGQQQSGYYQPSKDISTVPVPQQQYQPQQQQQTYQYGPHVTPA